MKRIGVIGTGKHGSRYANHIVKDIDGFTLAGISRRSTEGEEQARQWGTAFFGDWRELVTNPEVDAVVGVTVPSLNLEIARLCARERKPLLLEKPLAGNSHDAAEIVRIMEEADCPLTVGQTLRYNPVIGGLASRLPGLGVLHSVAVNQRIEPSSLAWHDDPEVAGAGVIIHTAVHVFDALRVITGLRILRVVAAGRCVHSRCLEDLVKVLMEFENGVLGTLDVSKVGHARSGRFEFICQDGQLHGEQVHGCIQTVRRTAIQDREQFPPVPTIRLLLEDWARFLDTGENNPVTGREGLYAVQVCDACIRSMATKGWVDVA